MLRWFKIGIKNLLSFFRVIIFNYKNNTDIRSLRADLRAKYGYSVIVSENTTVGKDVEIGDYSYINSNSYIEKCSIGKYCSISSGVYICPAEHKLKYITTHPIIKSEDDRRKVIIGNDVLISLNSIILEGVTIGDGAVIGAGAVVTKDVAPYEIVGGVPAKHIAYRFEQNKIDYLQRIKWWNWGNEKIEENISWFRNEKDIIK